MGREPHEVPARFGIQPHALTKVANRYLVTAGVMAGVSAAGAATSLWAVPVLFGTIAGWLGFAGLRIRRDGAAVQIINRAFHAVVTGDLDDARLLHGIAEQHPMSSAARRAITIQQAIMALRDGDLAEARRRCDQALESPTSWLSRQVEEVQQVSAHGLRALILAAQGQSDEALVAARLVREHPAPSPDALARAELGVALILQRSGERDALRRHLAEHRHLLQNHTAPRERAIYRGLERMLQTKGQSVYRKPAEAEAPPPDDWIAKVVPEIADFVRQRDDAEPLPEGPTEVPLEGLPEEQRKREAQRFDATKPSRKDIRQRQKKPTLVLWVVLVVLIAAILMLLPEGGTPDFRDVDVGQFALVVAVFFQVLLVATIAISLRRHDRLGRRLVAAVARRARGDHEGAAAELEALATQPAPNTAASAHQELAGMALREGDINRALHHVDLGLGKLSAHQRAIGSDILVPSLLTERAVLLAAQGKLDPARAALTVVFERHPSYPYADRAKRRLALYDAAHRGDVETLARLAHETTETGLTDREELLLDLARATLSPGAMRPGERERLADAVEDPGLDRAWVECLAPGVLRAFEGATATSG